MWVRFQCASVFNILVLNWAVELWLLHKITVNEVKLQQSKNHPLCVNLWQFCNHSDHIQYIINLKALFWVANALIVYWRMCSSGKQQIWWINWKLFESPIALFYTVPLIYLLRFQKEFCRILNSEGFNIIGTDYQHGVLVTLAEVLTN